MVAIHSAPKAVARYQRLLISEWTQQFPKEVLSLLWSIVRDSAASAETENLLPFLDPESTAGIPAHHFQEIARRIAEGTALIRLAELPPFPLDYVPPRKLSGAAGRAIRLAAYLTLPAHT